MKKIIVTGAAGMIGSAIIAELNQQGHDNIIAVDILGSGEHYQNLIELNISDYYESDVFVDIIEHKPNYFGDIDKVFHLGGISSTQETDNTKLITVNYALSKLICAWSMSVYARFIYASSAATYGDGEQGMDDKDENLHRLRPQNMYAYTKHLFDLYVQKTDFLNHIVGLKFFNIFGPNEYHKGSGASMIYQSYKTILAGESVKLFKSNKPNFDDGDQQRDFLYIKDAAAVAVFLAKCSSASGLFNVGNGTASSWNELVLSVYDALNTPPNIQYIEMPESLRKQYQYYTCANLSKLREHGFTYRMTSLRDAIFDYVQNYLIPHRYLSGRSDKVGFRNVI